MTVAELTPPARTSWEFPNKSDLHPQGYLSPSQVGSLMCCPRCWYYERVLKLPKPTSIHFAIGGFAHRAAEHLAKKVLDRTPVTPAVLEECMEAGAEDYDTRTSIPVDADSGVELVVDLGKFDSLGAAKDESARLTRFVLPELAKVYRNRRLLASEYDLGMLPEEVRKAALPFDFEGRIDTLYGDEESGVPEILSDLKTSAQQRAIDQINRLQLSIYGYFFHVGGCDVRLVGDVLAKTKAPSFMSYWLGAESDGMVTADEYQVVRQIIIDAAEIVQSGRFPIGFGWNGLHNYDHGIPTCGRAANFE